MKKIETKSIICSKLLLLVSFFLYSLTIKGQVSKKVICSIEYDFTTTCECSDKDTPKLTSANIGLFKVAEDVSSSKNLFDLPSGLMANLDIGAIDKDESGLLFFNIILTKKEGKYFYNNREVTHVGVQSEFKDILKDKRMCYNYKISGIDGAIDEKQCRQSDPCSKNFNWRKRREGYMFKISYHMHEQADITSNDENSEYSMSKGKINLSIPNFTTYECQAELKVSCAGETRYLSINSDGLMSLSYTDIVGSKGSERYIKWAGKEMAFSIVKTLENGLKLEGNALGGKAFYPDGIDFEIMTTRATSCQDGVITVKFTNTADLALYAQGGYKWQLNHGVTNVSCDVAEGDDGTYIITVGSDEFDLKLSRDITLILSSESNNTFATKKTFRWPGKPPELIIAKKEPLFKVDDKEYDLMDSTNPYVMLDISDPSIAIFDRKPYEISYLENGKSANTKLTINSFSQPYEHLPANEKAILDAEYDSYFSAHMNDSWWAWIDFVNSRIDKLEFVPYDGIVSKMEYYVDSWPYDSFAVLGKVSEQELYFINIQVEGRFVANKVTLTKKLSETNVVFDLPSDYRFENFYKILTIEDHNLVEIFTEGPPSKKIVDYKSVTGPVNLVAANNKYCILGEERTYAIFVPQFRSEGSFFDATQLLLAPKSDFILYKEYGEQGVFYGRLDQVGKVVESRLLVDKPIRKILYIDNEERVFIYEGNDGTKFLYFIKKPDREYLQRIYPSIIDKWKEEFKAAYKRIWLNTRTGVRLDNVPINEEFEVTITDNDGCEHKKKVTVNAYPGDPVSIETTNATQCQANGKIKVTHTDSKVPSFHVTSNDQTYTLNANSSFSVESLVAKDYVFSFRANKDGDVLFTRKVTVNSTSTISVTSMAQTSVDFPNGELHISHIPDSNCKIFINDNEIAVKIEDGKAIIDKLESGIYPIKVKNGNCLVFNSSKRVDQKIFECEFETTDQSFIGEEGKLTLKFDGRGSAKVSCEIEPLIPGKTEQYDIEKEKAEIKLNPGNYKITVQHKGSNKDNAKIEEEITIAKSSYSAKVNLIYSDKDCTFSSFGEFENMPNCTIVVKNEAQDKYYAANDVLPEGKYEVYLRQGDKKKEIGSFTVDYPVLNLAGNNFVNVKCSDSKYQYTPEVNGGFGGDAKKEICSDNSSKFEEISQKLLGTGVHKFDIKNSRTTTITEGAGTCTINEEYVKQFSFEVIYTKPIYTFSATGETLPGQKDGTIRVSQIKNNVNNTDYQFSNSNDWLGVTSSISGLAPGIHQIKTMTKGCGKSLNQNEVDIPEAPKFIVEVKENIAQTKNTPNGRFKVKINDYYIKKSKTFILESGTTKKEISVDGVEATFDELSAGKYKLSLKAENETFSLDKSPTEKEYTIENKIFAATVKEIKHCTNFQATNGKVTLDFTNRTKPVKIVVKTGIDDEVETTIEAVDLNSYVITGLKSGKKKIDVHTKDDYGREIVCTLNDIKIDKPQFAINLEYKYENSWMIKPTLTKEKTDETIKQFQFYLGGVELKSEPYYNFEDGNILYLKLNGHNEKLKIIELKAPLKTVITCTSMPPECVDGKGTVEFKLEGEDDNKNIIFDKKSENVVGVTELVHSFYHAPGSYKYSVTMSDQKSNKLDYDYNLTIDKLEVQKGEVEIPNYEPATFSSLVVTPTSCNGNDDGKISFELSDMLPDKNYSYALDSKESKNNYEGKTVLVGLKASTDTLYIYRDDCMEQGQEFTIGTSSYSENKREIKNQTSENANGEITLEIDAREDVKKEYTLFKRGADSDSWEKHKSKTIEANKVTFSSLIAGEYRIETKIGECEYGNTDEDANTLVVKDEVFCFEEPTVEHCSDFKGTNGKIILKSKNTVKQIYWDGISDPNSSEDKYTFSNLDHGEYSIVATTKDKYGRECKCTLTKLKIEKPTYEAKVNLSNNNGTWVIHPKLDTLSHCNNPKFIVNNIEVSDDTKHTFTARGRYELYLKLENEPVLDKLCEIDVSKETFLSVSKYIEPPICNRGTDKGTAEFTIGGDYFKKVNIGADDGQDGEKENLTKKFILEPENYQYTIDAFRSVPQKSSHMNEVTLITTEKLQDNFVVPSYQTAVVNLSTTPVSCSSSTLTLEDGIVDIELQNKVAERVYSYSIDKDEWRSEHKFDKLSKGAKNLYVKADNSCIESETSFEIESKVYLEKQFVVRNQTDNVANGRLSLTLDARADVEKKYLLFKDDIKYDEVSSKENSVVFDNLEAAKYRIETMIDGCKYGKTNSVEIQNKVFSFNVTTHPSKTFRGNGEIDVMFHNFGSTIKWTGELPEGFPLTTDLSDATTSTKKIVFRNIKPGTYVLSGSTIDEEGDECVYTAEVIVDKPRFSAKVDLSSITDEDGKNSGVLKAEYSEKINYSDAAGFLLFKQDEANLFVECHEAWDNLSEGKYRIDAVNSDGDDRVEVAVFTIPLTQIDSNADIAKPKCAGRDGYLSTKPSGGFGEANFSFKSNNHPTYEKGTEKQFMPQVGRFNYSIKDYFEEDIILEANSATVTKVHTTNFGVEIPQNDFVTAKTVSHQDITCFGLNDGVISIDQVSGGVYSEDLTPYYNDLNIRKTEYEFSVLPKGSTAEKTWSSYTASKYHKSPALYEVFLKDVNNGCPEVLIGEVNVLEPSKLEIVEDDIIQPTCELPNGVIIVKPSGGTGQISYTWGIDEEKNTPKEVQTDSREGQRFEELRDGMFVLTITDKNNCSVEEIFDLNEYENPSIINQESQIASCFGANDGVIEVTEISSNFELERIELLQGEEKKGEISSIGEQFLNLYSGNYQLDIVDKNNCHSNDKMNVFVGEPDQLRIEVRERRDITEKGGSNGKIVGVVRGGNVGEQKVELIDSGDETVSEAVITQNGNFSFKGLSVGNYRINVSDGKCDYLSDIIAIDEPSTELTLIETHGDARCKAETGFIHLDAKGGWGDYSYRISPLANFSLRKEYEKLKQGVYQVQVRDGRGAIATKIVTITEPEHELIIQVTDFLNPSCSNSGNVVCEVNGGTAPYNLAINDEAEVENVNETQEVKFDNLSVGFQEILVKDSRGCESVAFPELTDSDLLKSVSFTFKLASTQTARNGRITAEVEGGIAPYSYEWRDMNANVKGNSKVLRNVSSGLYVLKVTDSSGCQLENQSCYLPSLTNVAIEPTIIRDETHLAADDGFAYFDIEKRDVANIYIQTPFSKEELHTDDDIASHFGDDSTFKLENLSGGKYAVVIDTKSGERRYSEFTIEPYRSFDFYDIDIMNVAEPGKETARIIATVKGGAKPYRFEWRNLSGNATPTSLNEGDLSTLANIGAGNFKLTVVDRFDNTIEKVITVEEPSEPLLLSVKHMQHESCKGYTDAYVELEAKGGWGNYQFRHDNSDLYVNDMLWTNLDVREHTFWVIDKMGVEKSLKVNITEPDFLHAKVSVVDSVNCFGASDGIITFELEGGTAPYKFAMGTDKDDWIDGTTANNLSQGEYTFYFTDNNNCVGQDILNVKMPEPEPLLFEKKIITHTTCELDNGAITVEMKGGTAPYHYQWQNSAGDEIGTEASINELKQANTYQVDVSDYHGCKQQLIQFIKGSKLPEISVIETTPVKCYGGASGTAVVTSVAEAIPAAPYQLTWSDGQEGETSSGWSKGLFSVTLLDANNCEATKEFIVTEPDSLSINLSERKHADCYGYADGYIDIDVRGGVGDYRYEWSNGTTTKRNDNLSKGIYSIILKDKNECELVRNFGIDHPDSLSIDLVDRKNADCYGYNDGYVEIESSGGTGGHNYKWSNGEETKRIKELAKDVYTVTLTDNHNCELVRNFGIDHPDSLSITIAEKKDADCYGYDDGFIDLMATGGTGEYNFKWSNGATSKKADGLEKGLYSVELTDVHNCYLKRNFSIDHPDSLSISIADKKDADCYGSSDGFIQLNTSGGTGAYSFEWSNGALTQDIDGLAKGLYSVEFTDAHNCYLKRNFSIDHPEPIKIELSYQQDASCYGYSDGELNVKATGGTGDYNYLWDTGTKVSRAKNLAKGEYEVTIKDEHNCEEKETYSVDHPDSLSISLVKRNNALCYGSSDGFIQVSSVGGTGRHNLSWSDGQIGTHIYNLAKDVYTVTLTDNHNCELVRNFGIDHPDSLSITIADKKDADCYGYDDGFIDLKATGGTGEYNFKWSNGANTQKADGLEKGLYSVELTDIHNCYLKRNFSIDHPDSLSISITDKKDADCYGYADGFIQLNTSGGTGEYNFKWSNGALTQDIDGLGKGLYSVEFTDAHNCYLKRNFSIDHPEPIKIELSYQQDASCYGYSDGELNVKATGGTGDYSYLWDTGTKVSRAKNLAKGEYEVTIKDEHNCEEKETYSVDHPDSLSISLVKRNNALCYGSSDGFIQVSSVGGTGRHNLSWSHGQIGTHIYNLAKDVYTVTLTDNHNCELVRNFGIDHPDSLSITIADKKDADCYGYDDGFIDLMATGGTGEYNFKWSNGATSKKADGLEKGLYSVELTDIHNCYLKRNFSIDHPDSLSISITDKKDADCYGYADGFIQLNTSGGTGEYGFKWSNGALTQDIDGLAKGLYSVEFTDAHNCYLKRNFSIDHPDSLHMTLLSKQNAHCFGYKDGMIEVKTTGGTGAYAYNWDRGDKEAKIENLPKGVYSVTVTDEHKCKLVRNWQITEPEKEEVDLGEDLKICPNNTLTFDGQSFDKHQWSTSGGVISDQRYLTVGEANDYYLQVTNSIGCFAYDTITLSIGNDALKADFLMSSAINLEDTLQIYELSNMELDSMKWEYSNLAFEELDENDSPDYLLQLRTLATGMYNVALQAYSSGCFSKVTKQVEILNMDGESELDDLVGYHEPLIQSVQVAPNPSSGTFTVEIGLRETADVNLMIYSMNEARQIDKRQSRGLKDYEISYQLHGLNVGVYLVIVTSQNERKQVKIIIK